MLRSLSWWVIPVGLLVLAAVPASVQAQEDGEGITYCGEERHGVQLRNHNRDLNPWNDPVPEDHAYRDSDSVPEVDPVLVESSWQFINQVQTVVDPDHPRSPPLESGKAGSIQSWWFGFGPIKDIAVFEGAADCKKPWSPGIQLYSYRSDANPEDGFFIPINTTGVPDGTYGYVVYACTEREYASCQPTGVDDPETGEPIIEDNLVAAGWGKATVYNGREHCEEGELQGTPLAGHDLSCMRSYDFIEPWPKILPGDGTQTNDEACDAPAQRCLTIEFGERLASMEGSQAPNQTAVRLWVNGVEKTDQLEVWTPPERDNDLIPGNDGPHTGHPASDCQVVGPVQDNMPPDARLCQKVVWGDGFTWEAPRSFELQDEFRVWAKDRAGNTVEKVISLEDETRGAVIPLIEADLTVNITPKEQRIQPGDAKTFEVHVENGGEDTVHTFPVANASGPVETVLSDDHVDIPGGGNRTVQLQVAPSDDAEEGDQGVEVVFEYISGQRRIEEKAFATVVVDEDAELSAGGHGSSDGQDSNESIGPDSTSSRAGFNRTCSVQAELEVCSIYPDPLKIGETFTYEVNVQRAKEDVEKQHEFSAGEATLTIQYLDESGEEIAEPQTFEMNETDNGVYQADVTLEQRAPMIHIVFDSEKVKVQQMIKRPQEEGDDGGTLPVPGPGPLALVAAAGVAGLRARSFRRSG